MNSGSFKNNVTYKQNHYYEPDLVSNNDEGLKPNNLNWPSNKRLFNDLFSKYLKHAVTILILSNNEI